ncbi:hypothetical protein DF141_33950 [Burkholderia cenocepacia]|nr:hypothetical protein DF141_33950 [Burkholderia cenocepacia]RQV06276.1 hypothetical protein DF039_31875 [Burkholderia cenocepacia]RQZ82567.1 hypothetical protein DF058_33855 [Burkholderia cenocepacia]RRA03637.1 hypothetical protein DF059_34005 [Burkholderia cenocepacia]
MAVYVVRRRMTWYAGALAMTPRVYPEIFLVLEKSGDGKRKFSHLMTYDIKRHCVDREVRRGPASA